MCESLCFQIESRVCDWFTIGFRLVFDWYSIGLRLGNHLQGNGGGVEEIGVVGNGGARVCECVDRRDGSPILLMSCFLFLVPYFLLPMPLLYPRYGLG